jgi:hypothetical protein
MVTADHSRLAVEILAAEGAWLRCEPPRDHQDVGEELTLVIGDGQRAGYEIDCVVASLRHDAWLRLAVVDVRRVKPRRRYARTDVSESALVRPPGGEAEFDVQVVDIGTDGVAFVCDRWLAVGDSVAGMLNVGPRAFPIRARIVHVRSLGFGRVQVGCQFTEIAQADRMLLDHIAKHAPSDRRGLRPIELVGKEATRSDDPNWPSLQDLQCEYETTSVPAPRYCRPCGRVTLQNDTASPGDLPAWRCPTC